MQPTVQENACAHVQSGWHLIRASRNRERAHEHQHGLSRAWGLVVVSERSHVFFTGGAPRQSMETERCLFAPLAVFTFSEQAEADQQCGRGACGMAACWGGTVAIAWY